MAARKANNKGNRKIIQVNKSMNGNELEATVGFAQEIPGGFVFEIGNSWLQRRIHCIQGRIGTTSLVHAVNAEEYLDETVAEFSITVAGEGQTVELDFRDFHMDGYEIPEWDDNKRRLEIKLSTELNDQPLRVSVFYEALAGEDFLSKWITVHPCELENFAVTEVTLENLRLKEMVEGAAPAPRYSRQYENHEDDVHGEPDKANVQNPESSFKFGDFSRSVLTYWGYGEGFYFFTRSLTGEESFNRPTGLMMKHQDYVPLTKGFTTGAAIIGAYTGPPEVGFKRYTQHLQKHWCVIDDKSVPVAWSTWLARLTDYDRTVILEQLSLLQDAGFYQALHLDLGWEADAPLKVNASRFPNGIKEIARRAKESAGLDMSYWVNPFSCSYWKSKIEDEHPEWTVPGKVSQRSGAKALCVMSDYYEYVKKRFVDVVNEMGARSILWDGNDWNIPECSSRNHDHRNQQELSINGLKRLAEICEAAHQARPDLIISAFSLPFNNHYANALDQQQISDTHEFPNVQSELIQRQQLYQMTWEHPFRAIRGSWYGTGWHEAGEAHLSKRSMRELMHAEMSMIANGLAQSGGAIDLASATPEFIDFLKKLFAFRRRFEKYFNTYQHVIGFPDGENVDGSGHIVDNAGFIVLVNPSLTEQSVELPLAAPELELSSLVNHQLSDWRGLERGVLLDSAKIDDAPVMEMGPLEVLYVGVNVV